MIVVLAPFWSCFPELGKGIQTTHHTNQTTFLQLQLADKSIQQWPLWRNSPLRIWGRPRNVPREPPRILERGGPLAEAGGEGRYQLLQKQLLSLMNSTGRRIIEITSWGGRQAPKQTRGQTRRWEAGEKPTEIISTPSRLFNKGGERIVEKQRGSVR